jgi:hypothetical protein
MYNFPYPATVGQTTQTPNGVFTWDGIKWAPSPSSYVAGNANPLMDGAAAPGVSGLLSRQDHVHPTDTTRAALAGSSSQSFLVANGAANTNQALAANQLQTASVGNSNAGQPITSISVTTPTLTAPCNGFAFVFVDFSADQNSGGFSMSASLGGLAQQVGMTYGYNGYGFAYLPMSAGQGSTFTGSSSSSVSTNMLIAIRAFFIPSPGG